MRIFALTNIKGGVGKTTTAVNLAYLCARTGCATLLWDLDPQCGSTYALHGDALPVSVRKLVRGKVELPEVVVSSGHPHLDLLPADLSYRNLSEHLAERRHPTERLLKMSRSLRAHYGALFLDCPAGISLLSENVLRAADVVIVPLIPAPLSVRMLHQLKEFVAQQDWHDLQLLPFFSMVDRRRSLHQELIEQTRAQFPDMLATEVPYRSEIERMTQRRAPLPAYAPHSEAARIYQRLWAEICMRARLPPQPTDAFPSPRAEEPIELAPGVSSQRQVPASASSPEAAVGVRTTSTA